MSNQKNLKTVFSAAPKVSGAPNAFPKQVLKSKTAVASETTRSTRDGTTKCCSIGNCPGESLEVGGTVSVVVLQEDEKPMCVRTIAGCAPLQRPIEEQACLYDGTSLVGTALIGGSYPLLCVPDESETVTCVSTIDFYVVYAGSAVPSNTVLGNIVLHLNSDTNKRNLSIQLANVIDLISLVGTANVNHLLGGVPSDACLTSQPTAEDPFSTTVFRLNLAQVFGAGFTLVPKDSLVVDYSFATNPLPANSADLRSIVVKARGAVQDKTCGLGFAPIKNSIFVDNLKIITLPVVEAQPRQGEITFCLLNCQDGKVIDEILFLTFIEVESGITTVIPNVKPTEAGKNCYSITRGFTQDIDYILKISLGECVLYTSVPFFVGQVS